MKSRCDDCAAPASEARILEQQLDAGIDEVGPVSASCFAARSPPSSMRACVEGDISRFQNVRLASAALRRLAKRAAVRRLQLVPG
jgi:hypothetical protein